MAAIKEIVKPAPPVHAKRGKMRKESKIGWCKKQSRGITIIEPNIVLSKAYMKEAEETLDAMLSLEGKWKVITAYYSCYNALYSVLMKAGIKCEIHDCTLSLMDFLGFDDVDKVFLEKLKIDRIDAQYYLKDKKIGDVQKVKSFVNKCKQILGEDLSLFREKVNDAK